MMFKNQNVITMMKIVKGMWLSKIILNSMMSQPNLSRAKNITPKITLKYHEDYAEVGNCLRNISIKGGIIC